MSATEYRARFDAVVTFSNGLDDIQGGGRRPAHSILLRADIPGFGSFPTRAYATIPRP